MGVDSAFDGLASIGAAVEAAASGGIHHDHDDDDTCCEWPSNADRLS